MTKVHWKSFLIPTAYDGMLFSFRISSPPLRIPNLILLIVDAVFERCSFRLFTCESFICLPRFLAKQSFLRFDFLVPEAQSVQVSFWEYGEQLPSLFFVSSIASLFCPQAWETLGYGAGRTELFSLHTGDFILIASDLFWCHSEIFYHILLFIIFFSSLGLLLS